MDDIKCSRQPFQHIMFQTESSAFLSVCVLPHIEMILDAEVIASIMESMRVASKKDAPYDDTFTHEVEYMKNASRLIFFGAVLISNLTDIQWVDFYRALKEWQAWGADGAEGEFIRTIAPNHRAYQLFDDSLSESEVAEVLKTDWEEIFDNSGVNLF